MSVNKFSLRLSDRDKNRTVRIRTWSFPLKRKVSKNMIIAEVTMVTKTEGTDSNPQRTAIYIAKKNTMIGSFMVLFFVRRTLINVIPE